MDQNSLRKIRDLSDGQMTWVARCIKKWMCNNEKMCVEDICIRFAKVSPKDGMRLLRAWSTDWYEYAINNRTREIMTQKEKIFEFPDDFLPYEPNRIQREAKEIFETQEDKNLLVVAPTGMGKTDVGEMAVYRAIQQGSRALWLSPLKSDTKEKYEHFKERGYDVMLDTGDYRSDMKKYSKSTAGLVILTNERAASILRSAKKRDIVFEGNSEGEEDEREDIKPVDVVVIDEIHNFGTAGRGPVLELFIIELRTLYPEIVIVGLSATIGNPEEVARWYGAELIMATEDERPVPLTKRVCIYEDQHSYQANEREKIMHMERIFERHKDAQFIAFCTSQDRTKNLARKYCGLTGSKTNMSVDIMLKKGFGYHNASLPSKTREKIEEGFKSGDIKTVFSTPTLAQGVNLPADVTIGFDVHFYSYLTGENILIDHNTFNQLGGRAGRPGLSEHGYFYSLTSEEDFGAVVMRMDETMVCYSWIWSKLCDTVLVLFVDGICQDRETLMEMKDKIYNFQVYPEDKEFINEEKLDKELQWLIEHEFLEEVAMDHIRPTWKGRITAYLMISPYTAQHFYDVADTVKYYHKPEHVFAVLLNIEEFLQCLVVRYAKDRHLLDVGHAWINLVQCKECKTLNSFADRPKCPQCNNEDPYKFQVYNFDDRMYKAFSMVFRNEIEKDVPLEKRKIRLSPTDIGKLKGEVNRLLSAACVLLKDHADIGVIETAALLANAGRLDLRVVELLKVDGIGMTYATRLVNAGICSVADFVGTDSGYLAKVMEVPAKRVVKLVHNAEEYYRDA